MDAAQRIRRLDSDEGHLMTDLERRYVEGQGWQTVENVSSQTVVVTEFNFSFDTFGLTQGVVFAHVPAGSYLLDIQAKVLPDGSWNGQTPKLDCGWLPVFAGYPGLFSQFGHTSPDINLTNYNDVASDGVAFSPYLLSLAAASIANGAGCGLPLFFAKAADLSVWVTQDGFQGGADPGASAGVGQMVTTVLTP